jgi:hypothetical protein
LLENANELMRIRRTMPDPDASPGIAAVEDARKVVVQRGGYKHSKTNSRKYMVKKFRSARNSIRRKKRRRSKTLRRRSTRK